MGPIIRRLTGRTCHADDSYVDLVRRHIELRDEYDKYRRDAQAHVQETDRVIAELRTHLAHAAAMVTEIKLSYVGTARRPLPESVQALIDWHLREPVAAVLPLPSRDSVRTELAQWQRAPEPGMCEKCRQRPVWRPDLADQFLGHFCEPCINDCHERIAGHMCVIDRWEPTQAVAGRET